MDKIGIAICDDQHASHVILHKMIEKFVTEEKIECSIFHYTNAIDLIDNIDAYSIVFLDIMMPDMDGIEAGVRLKRTKSSLFIVMISATEDRIKECFEIGARGYITKPIEQQNVNRVLEHALFGLIGRKKIVVRFEDTNVMIEQNQIIAVKSRGDYVLIHTEDRDYTSCLSLKKILLTLDDSLFLRIKRGSVINMNQVKKLEHNSLLMNDGKRYDISIRLRKEVIRKIINFEVNYKYYLC